MYFLSNYRVLSNQSIFLFKRNLTKMASKWSQFKKTNFIMWGGVHNLPITPLIWKISIAYLENWSNSPTPYHENPEKKWPVWISNTVWLVQLIKFHHPKCAYLPASNYISECLWQMALLFKWHCPEPGIPLFKNYHKSAPKCLGPWQWRDSVKAAQFDYIGILGILPL